MYSILERWNFSKGDWSGEKRKKNIKVVNNNYFLVKKRKIYRRLQQFK